MDRKIEKWVAEKICEKINFKLEDFLRIDSTGLVYSAIHEKGDRRTAIKISVIHKEEEKEEWGRLLHPYILPALYTFEINQQTIAWQIPAYNKKIGEFVDPNLSTDPKVYYQVKKWLYEVLCALRYLHHKRLHYLNLTTDSVLISPNSTAMLSDFGRLQYCTNSFEDIQLPDGEYCMGNHRVDMLSYGIFALKMLLAGRYDVFIENCECAPSGDYTTYAMEFHNKFTEKFYDQPYFYGLMKQAHNEFNLNHEEVRDCWLFLKQFICYHPEQPITSDEAIEHYYLQPWKGNSVLPRKRETHRLRRVKSNPEVLRNDIQPQMQNPEPNLHWCKLSDIGKRWPSITSCSDIMCMAANQSETSSTSDFEKSDMLSLTGNPSGKKKSRIHGLYKKAKQVAEKFKRKSV